MSTTINEQLTATAQLNVVRFNAGGTYTLVYDILDTNGTAYKSLDYVVNHDGSVVDQHAGILITNQLPDGFIQLLQNLMTNADQIMAAGVQAGTVKA